MTIGEAVKYIDPQGEIHDALVVAENALNEGVLDLAYVVKGEVEKVYGVVHESHASKDENHPDLPRIVLHAWKEASGAVEAAVEQVKNDAEKVFAHDDEPTTIQ